MTMAVETNKGATPTTPNPGATLTGVPAASSTLTGMAAASAGKQRRKRSSSLMQIQSSLPSVESSLDDFIARANQTLTDPATWQADQVKQAEEDEQRREQDALRWKAAEQQLREAEAREQSLRRQLDGLQGRLAEAEARAAVAGNAGNQDGVIADLKIRMQRMDEKIRAAEQQAQQSQHRAEQLAVELTTARSQAAAAAAAPAVRDSLPTYENEELQERVRIAEAKAQKALAVARAASAGLTVNPADITAIESGLVVPSFEQPKGTNWGLVIGALVIGAAAMFGVSKFVLNTAPAQPAAQVAPGTAPTGAPAAAPGKPIVTPIEDEKPAAPADQAATAPAATAPAATAPAAAPAPTPTNDADKLAAEKAAAEKVAAEQAAADKAVVGDKSAADKKALAEKAAAEQAAADASAKKQTHAAAAPKHATTTTTKAHPAGGLADPFGGAAETPAPKKAAGHAKTADKKQGGIVDPF
jgi:hypothetical protein